jgi:hypothetical protein
MKSKCIINTTNFIKIKIYFKQFLSMFAFLVIVMYLILCIYFFNITSYEIEKCNFFGIRFTIIYKKIMKILFNNDMVKVQTWVSLKNSMM